MTKEERKKYLLEMAHKLVQTNKKSCKICNKPDHMSRFLDPSYPDLSFIDTRWQFCFNCRPVLDDDSSFTYNLGIKQ